MDFEDILILVVAAIGWIYSNFRKLQKQAVERSREITVPSDIVVEQRKPEPVAEPSLKKKPLVRVVNKLKPSLVINEERKKAEEFWSQIRDENTQPEFLNIDVDKINSEEVNNENSPLYINIADEIRSGKTDWRKAIIYNEILRPVYF